ncbi:MAG TPA: glycosyl hydrolase family 79 C-terminal domain-containing protein [Mucilaginibacter sp.]|nr:glycosyl hydrolase family 79 C-terminal domain-containing protein [Mucilaginibacter sp.]
MNTSRYVALLMLLILSACSKKQAMAPPPHVQPDTTSIPVGVTINQNQRGNTIAPAFEGLSFEVGSLTNGSNLLSTGNTVLLHLIKNLGPGVLRIGGNSSDDIFWTGHRRYANTGSDSLTTTDIDAFAAFAKATGWKVLFGFNLGSGAPQAAANEAAYINNSLGQSLYAFQTGNEPDLFFNNGHRTPAYSYADFQSEWETYLAAVRAAVPNAPFAGPDAAGNSTWVSQFIPAENKNIILADAHYYRTGPASDSSITVQTILAPDNQLPSYLETMNNASQAGYLAYRISECNSVFGGGKRGVSNVFGSALWALNFMWIVAENNSLGINFHGGNGGFYSPVDNGSGITTAMPEYYAMLAFKYGGVGGTIIPTTLNSTTYNCSAYACTNAGITYITLINMESDINLSFTVQLGKTAAGIKIARLTAPNIYTQAGVTFAGASVLANGTYNAGPTENHTINSNSFVLKVPAGNAAVIAVQ